MDLILANTGSYPRIGDTADQQLLRRTIAAWEKGEKMEEDLREAERRVTKAAIDEQLEAGLDLVTDGQICWYDPISHIAGKLEGVKINGLLRYFDTNFYFRQPVVKGTLRRVKPFVVDEYQFAASVSPKPVKAVLTGPYTLAKHSIIEDRSYSSFEKLLEDYTTAIVEEVHALVEAGARTIQIDEPAILKNRDEFDYLSASVKRISSVKGEAVLCLYVYFGDAAPLYSKLQTLTVDVIGIDFTYNEQLVEIVRTEGSEKALGLGLIDGRNTKLESAQTVSSALEKLLPAIKSSYSYLNPSCGLEYLPRDKALLKLKNLVSIGRQFISSR